MRWFRSGTLCASCLPIPAFCRTAPDVTLPAPTKIVLDASRVWAPQPVQSAYNIVQQLHVHVILHSHSLVRRSMVTHPSHLPARLSCAVGVLQTEPTPSSCSLEIKTRSQPPEDRLQRAHPTLQQTAEGGWYGLQTTTSPHLTAAALVRPVRLGRWRGWTGLQSADFHDSCPSLSPWLIRCLRGHMWLWSCCMSVSTIMLLTRCCTHELLIDDIARCSGLFMNAVDIMMGWEVAVDVVVGGR